MRPFVDKRLDRKPVVGIAGWVAVAVAVAAVPLLGFATARRGYVRFDESGIWRAWGWAATPGPVHWDHVVGVLVHDGFLDIQLEPGST
jgi:hypothetical protein